MSKILITGGAGYIGKKIAECLVDQDYDVVTIDRCENNSTKNFDHYCADLSNKNEVDNLLKMIQPQIIIHLAGVKKRLNDHEVFEESININLIGSLNLFDSIQKHCNPDSILVFGTAEEYGRTDEVITEETALKPINAYSFSKQCLFNLCEYYYRELKLPLLYLRPSLIYGPDQDESMFIPQMINKLHSNKEFKMTKGEQTRDFIFIDDLLEFISILIKQKVHKTWILNICSSEQHKIRDVAEYVGDILGKSELIKIGEFQYRTGEVMSYNMSNKRIVTEFGWKPKTSLRDGILKIINSNNLSKGIK